MQSFANFTGTSKPRQNLHLDHIDETMFIGGDSAAISALNLIESPYFITQKFDGAPSIFCGTDPEDGQFFVATKSVFNKTPKLYKTFESITDNESGGKAVKLCEALKWLQKLNIPTDTVLQGDLLWTTGDHVYETYDNERYVTVHPNTLVYGWLAESAEGKAVRNADLGIVFHTTYRGQHTLQNYQATFGANVDNLNQMSEVWVRDANYDANHVIDEDTQSLIKSVRNRIGGFDQIIENESLLPTSMVGCSVKTYVNSFVRSGQCLSEMTVNDYREFVVEKYVAAIDNLISESAIDRRKTQLRLISNEIVQATEAYANAFEAVAIMGLIKENILVELNANNNQKIFVKTKDGLQEAATEGYVFVGRDGNGVKVVDRSTFSHYNFSEDYVKGWQKPL